MGLDRFILSKEDGSIDLLDKEMIITIIKAVKIKDGRGIQNLPFHISVSTDDGQRWWRWLRSSCIDGYDNSDGRQQDRWQTTTDDHGKQWIEMMIISDNDDDDIDDDDDDED